jgi:hypothetical protein
LVRIDVQSSPAQHPELDCFRFAPTRARPGVAVYPSSPFLPRSGASVPQSYHTPVSSSPTITTCQHCFWNAENRYFAFVLSIWASKLAGGASATPHDTKEQPGSTLPSGLYTQTVGQKISATGSTSTRQRIGTSRQASHRNHSVPRNTHTRTHIAHMKRTKTHGGRIS